MTVTATGHGLNYLRQMRDFGFALIPANDMKQPRIAFKRFTRAGGGDLPTDVELADWLLAYPGCNWLLITEGARVGVVFTDVDDCAQAGEIVASGQQASPLQQGTRRGFHAIYRRTSPTDRVVSRNGHLTGPDLKFVDLTHTVSAAGVIAWGNGTDRFGHTKIDVKADGAYCVHAGSRRKDGSLYTLTFNGAPIDPLVAFNPEWLAANVPVFDNAAWERSATWLKTTRQSVALRARAARDKAFPQQRKNADAWKAAAASSSTSLTEPVIQWAVAQPNQVSHEVWRGIAVNLAAVFSEGGRAQFHQISAGYTINGGYSVATTDYCFNDALLSAESPGPMLYSTMQEHGYPGDVPMNFNSIASFLRAGEAKKTADELFAFLLKDLVYVLGLDRVYSHSRRTHYPVQSIRHMYSGAGVAARWESSLNRQTAEGATWEPSGRNVKDGYVNTFDTRELAVPGDDASPLPGFTAVMESLTQGVEGGARWHIQHIAWQFRNPGRGWSQAVVHHGAQGVGKGLLALYLRRLYGGYFSAVRSSDLASQFNGWLSEKLVIFGDEILDAAGGEYALSTQIKSYITEPTFSMNQKGLPQIQVSNHSRWYITSNKDKPLQLDADDRRYTVFNQTRKMDPCLGRIAFDEANSEDCGARLAAFLLSVDMTGFDPTQSLETAAKARLIECGFSPAEHYWKDCWRTGSYTTDEVYADFRAYCEERGFSAKTMERWSKISFSRTTPPGVVHTRGATGERLRTLTIPALPDGECDPTPSHRSRGLSSAPLPLPRREPTVLDLVTTCRQ